MITSHILELRHYTATPGRRPDLVQRFDDHTFAIFERLKFNLVGFWTDVEEPDQLHYMLAWDTDAERRRKWEEFTADPAWIEASRQSVTDSPLVTNISSIILQPYPIVSQQNL